MKKVLTVFAGILAVVVINAQSLEDIVKRYSSAMRYDKISGLSTIKISARMSMGGMDIPIEIWMKNPDKIKTITDFGGQQVISVFDGTKGYMINPMTGSSSPVEMTPREAKQVQNNNMFKNTLDGYLKEGKLTLTGEDNVDGKPAFRIKADIDGANSAMMFIDKETYLLIKTSTIIDQNGMQMTVDSYPSDYREINSLVIPMKTTSSAQGMDMVMTFDTVEVNEPMEDIIFKLQ